MGYLVKASPNADSRAYALEGIKDDVAAGLLQASSLVREEKQVFWYSVGELTGESPTLSFRFPCEHCRSWILARKIDARLQTLCEKCGQMSTVPDTENRQLDVLKPDIPREAKLLMTYGVLVATGGIITTVASYFTGRTNIAFFFLIIVGLGAFHRGWSQSAQIRHTTPLDRK